MSVLSLPRVLPLRHESRRSSTESTPVLVDDLGSKPLGAPGRDTSSGHGTGRSRGLSIQTAGPSRRPRARDLVCWCVPCVGGREREQEAQLFFVVLADTCFLDRLLVFIPGALCVVLCLGHLDAMQLLIREPAEFHWRIGWDNDASICPLVRCHGAVFMCLIAVLELLLCRPHSGSRSFRTPWRPAISNVFSSLDACVSRMGGRDGPPHAAVVDACPAALMSSVVCAVRFDGTDDFVCGQSAPRSLLSGIFCPRRGDGRWRRHTHTHDDTHDDTHTTNTRRKKTEKEDRERKEKTKERKRKRKEEKVTCKRRDKT